MVSVVGAVDRAQGNALRLCVSVWVEHLLLEARVNTRLLSPNFAYFADGDGNRNEVCISIIRVKLCTMHLILFTEYSKMKGPFDKNRISDN